MYSENTMQEPHIDTLTKEELRELVDREYADCFKEVRSELLPQYIDEINSADQSIMLYFIMFVGLLICMIFVDYLFIKLIMAAMIVVLVMYMLKYCVICHTKIQHLNSRTDLELVGRIIAVEKHIDRRDYLAVVCYLNDKRNAVSHN